MDPAKLKVVELRAELAARGLDTKGVKAVLVDRLKQAIEEETGQEVPDTSILETSTEENSYSEDKVDNSELDKENSESEQNTPEFLEESQDQPFEEQIQESEEPFQAEESEDRYQESEQDDSQKEREPSPEPERESTPEPSQGEYGEQENTFESENYGSEAYQSENYQPAPAPEEVSDSREEQKLEESDKSEDMEMENVTIKQESFPDDYKQQNYEEKPKSDQYQVYDSENAQDNDKKEHYEEEVKLEGGIEVKEERDDRQEDKKRKRSRWSPQPQQKQGWGQRPDWGRKDDEPDLDENSMVLGWYDSDLNLEVNREDFLEAGPMSAQGFGYIWAGCRATFGFNQGKICYEVKLLENHDVSHLEDEPSPHVLRVGWSTLDTDMMLGEEPKSYGYGGTGKISTNCKFSNYGTSFVAGDVITTYLDYGEHLQMSYAVNGQHLGVAFSISPSEIDNQPLFPHFLSKNIKFRVNFGLSEPQFPIEPEYTWAAHVPLDQRVAGPRRPERREDCEMLMMCGLPGCGKTTWANAYVKEHRDKFYNILGTNNLIDKMKIQGLPRKRNYHGRWDVLIDKCTKCLNKLLEMASRRRRNYILDQTNVYPSAQKRKMRNFGGFIRRAIVIVPTDEEFQRRCAKREAEEGKDIPDSAVLEMKANFRLPEEGEHFDEIRFIELNREESQPLVEQYNKEGRAAGFGQQAPFSGQGGGNKKFRPNDRPPFRGGGGFRGGRGGFGMDRKDRGPDRGPGGRGGFRSGGMDRGGRGGWGPRGGVPDRGPSRGGWRDRSPGGGFDRDMDSRPPGGGPWRNQRGGDRDRPYDRNQRGGPRGGGNFRDNDFSNRGGGFRDGGYDRDDYRGGYNNRGEDGFREGRGGGRGGRGGRGGFDRDNKGGGRGGFDRSRGGFNDRRGGGREGGFDRNRGGDNRGPRDNKGGVGGGSGQGNQGSGGQGWGNQSYQGGWGQGYNQQGYNQGYNQQGYNQGYNQQQPNPQQGWGQQAWGNKGTGQQQGVTGAAGTTATPATTGYNTTGYAQQATGYNQAAGYQGYWGQYGYGQGWTQNADGTYSYPQGWQGYGYNYGAAMTPAAGVTPGMTAATPAATAATPATAPQAPAK